jgi:hypothetical protein
MPFSKVLIFLSALFSAQISHSQITETEPNDPFPSGNVLEEGETISGQTCTYDNPDLFKITLPEDGKIRIFTETSGDGDNPASPFTFQLFNDQNDAWNEFSPNAGDFGLMVSESFDWCCIEAGDYYIQVYRGYAFEYCYSYTLSWELIPATYANDVEPNSIYTEALNLDYNSPTEGHLSFYGHPQGVGQDGIDYYQFVAPTNGTLRLFFEAEAQNSGSNFTQLTLYNSDGIAWTLQNSAVGSFQTPSSDTLIWECIGTDTMYLSISTTNFYDRGYSYRIRFDVIEPVFANDMEDNNTLETAQEIDPSLPVEGNQYFYGDNSSDNYKFTKPDAGDLKIVMRAETHTGDPTLGHSLQLFDSNFSAIGGQFTGPLGIYSVTAIDSITYANLPAGTYYMQTSSNYAFAACRSYQLTLSFDNLDGISNNTFLSSLSIYPNPSSGSFFLEVETTDTYEVSIYNSTGKLIQNRTLRNTPRAEFVTDGFAKGVYMIRISLGSDVVNHRMLVN